MNTATSRSLPIRALAVPNLLTYGRIAAVPAVVACLYWQDILEGGLWLRWVALVIFISAGVTDVLDGYYARKWGEQSAFGRMLDPIADKLLLFATLIPIFWMTRHPVILAADKVDYAIKWWGILPVWVALLLVGREVLITAFRFFAKRRGVVIPAVGAGKLKAVVQNIFIGATIAWFAWKDAIAELRLAGAFREFWDEFHGWFVAVTLAGAP